MPVTAGSVTSSASGFLSEISNLASTAFNSNIGQSIRDISKNKYTKGAILGGLFLAGVGKEVIKPTIKAGMDVAFDDPNADQKVLGTDLTPSMLVGANINGPVGKLARGANAYRFGVGATNPYYAQKNAGRGLGMLGAVGGGIYGYNKGFGGIKGAKGAVIGAIGGGVTGNIAGRAIGAGGSLMYAKQYAQTNAQVLSESPFYNKSLMTADRMNARGDIVLGAYNTRKGQY